MMLFTSLFCSAQPNTNYVANGSFEEYYICSGPPSYQISNAKNWLSIDSASYGATLIDSCNSQIPFNGTGYQYPRTGNAFMVSTWFCFQCGRGYLKNRLTANLSAGKSYCIKFYVNIANGSTYGMDGFGAYLGDHTIDTISKCTLPLTYLHPQVKNPIGNIVTDTLNWVPITGTFTANGTEKYLLLGNFLSDNSIDTLLINPSLLPTIFTDVLIDDVSCIDLNLPAYAGPDQPIYHAGDSVYIGRPREFALDDACTWYLLPNSTSTIATAAGLWVKPVTTSTYMVRQQLACGAVKWDTVVVYLTSVGIAESGYISSPISLWPNPVKDQLHISLLTFSGDKLATFFLFNNQGALLREEDLRFENGEAIIKTDDLDNGLYMAVLVSSKGQMLNKKLFIAR